MFVRLSIQLLTKSIYDKTRSLLEICYVKPLSNHAFMKIELVYDSYNKHSFSTSSSKDDNGLVLLRFQIVI